MAVAVFCARAPSAANYFSGELTVLRTGSDGALLPGVTTPLPGPDGTEYPGPVDIRQEGPHAHCFHPDPGSQYAFAADLGSDEVVVVSVDAKTGKMTVSDRMATLPGTGPRHCALSPDRTHLYVVRRCSINCPSCVCMPLSISMCVCARARACVCVCS